MGTSAGSGVFVMMKSVILLAVGLYAAFASVTCPKTSIFSTNTTATVCSSGTSKLCQMTYDDSPSVSFTADCDYGLVSSKEKIIASTKGSICKDKALTAGKCCTSSLGTITMCLTPAEAAHSKYKMESTAKAAAATWKCPNKCTTTWGRTFSSDLDTAAKGLGTIVIVIIVIAIIVCVVCPILIFCCCFGGMACCFGAAAGSAAANQPPQQ